MNSFFGNVRIDKFKRQYACYSGAFMNKSTNIDEGGKVILPPSALDELARMSIVWPIMFKITNDKKGVSTHCGVLEFSGEEGRIYIPFWMLEHLQVSPGQVITVENATLPKGSFVKLRPQQKAFIEISDPKAVLEQKLRNFSCLTKGDTIMISHLRKNYCIDIMEVSSNSKPNCDAISIVETDVKVEFDRPLDMPPSPLPQEIPKKEEAFNVKQKQPAATTAPAAAATAPQAAPQAEASAIPSFKAFGGEGRRLDGRKLSGSATGTQTAIPTTAASSASTPAPSPVSATKAQDGGVVFGGSKTASWRKKRAESEAAAGATGTAGSAGSGASTGGQTPTSTPTSAKPENAFKAFSGQGRSLK